MHLGKYLVLSLLVVGLAAGGVGQSMKDFGQNINLSVDSATGTPTVSKAQPVYLQCGDTSKTGNGVVNLDCGNINGVDDVTFVDKNGNLLDYEWEEFQLDTGGTGLAWVYNSWSRDGTEQAQIWYGDNTANTDYQDVTATWSNSGQNAAMVQHLNGDATDSTSNDNDGTINGASSVSSGQIGGAYDFDGSDDITIPHSNSLDLTAHTMMVWANADNIGSNWQGIAFKEQQYEIMESGNGDVFRFQVAAADGGGGTYFSVESSSYNTDTWYHLAQYYDGGTSGGTMEGFMDGSSEGTDNADIEPQNNDFTIGYNPRDGSNFDGTIDEVRVYSDVKSSDWIEADYDASSKAGQVFFSQTVSASINTAPQIDSTSHIPDPAAVGDSISYHANASDADGNNLQAWISVEYWNNGTEFISDVGMSEPSTYDFEAVDLFTARHSDNGYNATITVGDGAVNTTSEENFYLSDSAPVVSINDPENQTYFKYDVPFEYSVDASDAVPDENIDCSVDKDASLYQENYLKEGVNSTVAGTVSSGLGGHNVTVSCTDNAGNTGEATEHYSVKAFELVSNSTTSPVYETYNTTYTIQVKTGEMVQDLSTTLSWNGTDRSTRNYENGVTVQTISRDHFFQPLLVPSNASSFNWKFDYTANYTDLGGNSYSQETRTTTTGEQTVWWAYFDAKIQNNEKQVIEDENFNTSLTRTAKGDAEANETEFITFNGSTFPGKTRTLDAPLVNNANISKNVSGRLELDFHGTARTLPAANDSITIHRKILTNCVDQVKGVTGEKALTFKLLNEENQSHNLEGNIDYNFDTTHHGEHTRNYAFENNGVKNSSICLYPGWAEYNITGPLQYESEPEQNRLNLTFPDRAYNLFNEPIDNNSETVNLYLLQESLATPVYFSVMDESNDPVPEASIQVLRYFIGSNSYLTVAKAETDSEGVATTYMRVNEIYYKYIISMDGQVLLETDRQILICQSTPCTKEFQVDPQVRSEFFEIKSGFQHSCETNEDSQGNVTGLQCTVSHSSDIIKNASLNVNKKAVVGWEKVCNITVISSGSSMVCQFNEDVDGNVYRYHLQAWKDGHSFTLQTGILDYSKGLFEDNAEFAALMIFLTFSMLGLVSPSTSIAFSTIGVLLSWWMGLITISLGAAASLVVVAALVVMGGRT